MYICFILESPVYCITTMYSIFNGGHFNPCNLTFWQTDGVNNVSGWFKTGPAVH